MGLERLRVDFQPAALGAGEARVAPGLEVRAAACGDEQPLAGDRFPRLQLDHDADAALVDAFGSVAQQDRDPLFFEVRPQGHPGLGLLEAEERGSGLDDRDLAPQPGKRLRQFDADGAPAQHDQRLRVLAWNGCLAVGPVLDLVQPGNGRNCRRAAVRDHQRFGGHVLAALDLDCAQVDNLALAPDELRPGGLERGSRPRVVEVARHPQHALGDLREVQVPLHA